MIDPNAGDAEEQVEYFPSPSIADVNEAPAGTPQAAAPVQQQPVAPVAPEADEPVETVSADPTLWPDGHPRNRGRDAERTVPAKKDTGRFEHWQAEADRQKQRAEANEKLAQIGKLVVENPQLMEYLKNGPPQQTPPVPAPAKAADVAPAGLVKPTPPTRPERYDKVEAYADPASESFKYREALEAHRDAMIDYQEKREAQREQVVQQQVAQRRQMEARNQQLTQLQANLVTTYKMTPQEAIDFIQTFDKPDAVSIGNLVALYRLQRGSTKSTNQRQQELLERQRRNGAPTPAGLLSAEPAPEVDDETNFNMGLMKYSKVRKAQ